MASVTETFELKVARLTDQCCDLSRDGIDGSLAIGMKSTAKEHKYSIFCGIDPKHRARKTTVTKRFV